MRQKVEDLRQATAGLAEFHRQAEIARPPTYVQAFGAAVSEARAAATSRPDRTPQEPDRGARPVTTVNQRPSPPPVPKRFRIILYEPSGSGGVCHYTYNLAEQLALAGHDVTVATTDVYELAHLTRHFKLTAIYTRSRTMVLLQRVFPRLGERFRNDEALPHGPALDALPTQARSRMPPLLRILQISRLAFLRLKAILSFALARPDLVHFQWLMDRTGDYRFMRALNLLGFPLVYTAHDLVPRESDSPDDRVALQKIYKLVDRLIVHTESDRRELLQTFAVDPVRVAVIPHGSYDFFYGDDALSQQAARHALGIAPGSRVVLFFGLIKRYKGLEYLVDAFQQVKAHIANAMLLIVGKIYDEDAESFGYYSELLRQLANRGDVMCTPEYVPLEHVGSYFAASDVVVLPYVKASMSGVLLSAYAAGRPVIVTDAGGLSEAVEAGKSGIVVPPKDAAALAQGIMSILAFPERLATMGQYAKHLADTRYSWQSVALRTLDLYASLID